MIFGRISRFFGAVLGSHAVRLGVSPMKKKEGKQKKKDGFADPTYDTSCKLIRDERSQSVLHPINGDEASTVANFLPKLIGHTEMGGYAFTFEKEGQTTAFKHFYRSEFGNSPMLIKNLLSVLKDNGFNWLYLQEAKSSDPRASFGYLLGEMTKTYDAMPIVDKVTVDIANHSGFYGSKIFILDQYNQYDLHTQEWLPLENNVLLETRNLDEIEFSMNTDISLEDSKKRMVSFTRDLFVGWSKPQVLLTRAGHTFAFTNPYGKSVADITTPIFIQYGDYSTGKTTLLQYFSACHGIYNGKVQQMSLSKLLSIVCTSSRTFVPVDDPPKELIDRVTEALHNGCGSKNNKAGASLRDQDPIRSVVFSCKEFVFTTGIWSKIVMIYAPALRDKSVLTQVGVDDLAPKFNRYGPDCVRYNLGFVDVWNQWENNKHRYLSDSMKVIPEEMLRLSRTPRNFSYLLPFVEKMLQEEDYGVSYDQVLQYARESFGRLLRKLQLCNLVASGLSRSIDEKQTTDLPPPVVKIINFLDKQPQKKCFIRECGSVDGANISTVGIALRGATTTLAGCSNFKEILLENGIKVATRPTFRFLHEKSNVPFIKLAGGGKVVEGTLRTTNAIIFDSRTKFSEPFMRMIKDQDRIDGFKFNGDKYEDEDEDEEDDDVEGSDLSNAEETTRRSSQSSTSPGKSSTCQDKPSTSSDKPSTSPVKSSSPENSSTSPSKAATSGTSTEKSSSESTTASPVPRQTKRKNAGNKMKLLKKAKVETEKDEDDDDVSGCKCRSKCQMAAYCSCRNSKINCTPQCHPKSTKCKNH